MREVGTYLVVVYFLTSRDLDGPGTEVLPDEGALFRTEESGDVSCPR